MNPVLIYPIVFLGLFAYINQSIKLPENSSMIVYVIITIYYGLIRTVYGTIAAIIFILYDNSLRSQKEGFASSVPKVIYQTWSQKALPPKMAECVERLKQANPEFEHHLYDDAECRTFIKNEFDSDVLSAYDQLVPGAFKADLWRYCVLYKRGGIYVDIKFQCEPGFSLKDTLHSNFYVREYNHKGTGLYNHIVYTGVIGSRPNNPLFMDCIRQIVENVKNRYYGPEHTSPTGPWLFASKMDPDDFENIEYSYYETDGVGFIRHIENKTVIMSHYPEYRKEQKADGKSKYWKDAWINREMYA